jgi:hypothetical protein
MGEGLGNTVIVIGIIIVMVIGIVVVMDVVGIVPSLRI